MSLPNRGGRFYWLTAGGRAGTDQPSFGPFYRTQGHVALQRGQSAILLSSVGVRNGYLMDRQLRNFKWPGVLRTESPARCVITFPGPGAITDHSTLQFVSPNPFDVGAYIFEFKKVGAITPGNVAVDISAAVTPADVQAAFLTALATYNGTAPVASPSGYIGAGAAGSPVAYFVQAFASKRATSTAGLRALKGTWLSKTWGSLGNTAVLLSVPGEWTNRISGFSGGKARGAGIYGILEKAGTRSHFLPAYLPALEVPSE